MGYLILFFGFYAVISGIIVLARILTRKDNISRETWSGPMPSAVEQEQNRAWIARFFEDFPDSGLAEIYPDLFEESRIVLQYKKLEADLASGRIDIIDYELALEKLLPFVTIDFSSLNIKPCKKENRAPTSQKWHVPDRLRRILVLVMRLRSASRNGQ